MSEILTRLRGYNPPDRTIDIDRRIAVDIWDAVDEIERLRLALETATARAQSLSNELLDAIHARDNHRDRAATVSLMLDTIEGVATGQPGEIPTAVEDGWSTALGAVLALVRERDEWKAQAETDAAWARKTIEERDALLSKAAPPADAAREAVLAAREEAERLLAQPLFFRETMKPWCDALRSFLSATSSPAPAPSAKETKP